jgi:hypothetical protein
METKCANFRKFSPQDMILVSIRTLCDLVKENLIVPTGTLTPKHKNASKSSNTDFGPWLPQCLTEVVMLYKTLSGLDLPSEALTLVNNLIQDLR